MVHSKPNGGVIRSDELYTLDEFKTRLGVSNAMLRAARRAGLKVIYKHGRGFILGRDWIAYLLAETSSPLVHKDKRAPVNAHDS